MPARDPHVDDLSALFGLVREVRDDVLEMKNEMKHAADHGDRISSLEIEQAEMRGSIRVLLWLLPGGPALVAVIGGIAWYTTSR